MTLKMFLQVLLTVACLLFLNCTLSATPITVTVKDKTGKEKVIPGNGRWPKGATIQVFVPDDPRFDDIKTGIERWSDLLKDKDLKINVQKGSPPANATNAVKLNFVDPSTLPKDTDGKPNSALSGSFGNIVKQNGTDTAGPYTSGVMDFDKNVNKDGTASDFLKNLAEHEFGHVLGFADEPTEGGKPHNIMDPSVEGTGTPTFTDKDKAELNSLYASAGLPTPTGTMSAKVTPLPGGTGFLYTVTWLAGATIPFVQIGTNGASLFDITADGFSVASTNAFNPNPAGWFLLDPNIPFSLAGSVEDILALSSGEGGDYFTFLNELNPLGPEEPTATFGFTSPTGVAPVLTFFTADNFSLAQGPAAIPWPATDLMIWAGIGIIVALRGKGFRRIRRRVGTRPGLS